MSMEVLIGLAISMASLVFARMIGNKANDTIDAEKKSLLITIFPRLKLFQIIPLAVIFFIFLVGFSFLKSYFVIFFFATVSMILLHSALISAYMAYRLYKNAFSSKYITLFMLSQLVRIAGVIIMFTLFYLYMIKKLQV